MHIHIKTLVGQTITLEVNDFTTIKEIRKELGEILKCPSDMICLLYGGYQRMDEKFLRELSIVHGSTLQCVLRLRGGAGGFTCVDVNDNIILTLSSACLKFNQPDSGLNLIGRCDNPTCRSQNLGGFLFPMGYGFIQLLPRKNKFPCMACHPGPEWYDEKEHMFTPSNFVFYNCQSSITYCKAGNGKEGTSRLEIDAPEDSHKLRTFDEEGRGLAQYNFIQIVTRHNSIASFACYRCGVRTKREAKCGKGHFYHKTCKQGGCPECEVSLSRNKSIVRECHFRNADRWKAHVESRFDKLITFTSINSLLLAKLLSQGALHSVEVDKLNGISDNSDKNMAFYNFVKIRPDKANHFVDTLKYLCQSIPASILEEYE